MAQDNNAKRWIALTGVQYVNNSGKSVMAAEFEELKNPQAQDVKDLVELKAVIDIDETTINAVRTLQRLDAPRLEALRRALKL